MLNAKPRRRANARVGADARAVFAQSDVAAVMRGVFKFPVCADAFGGMGGKAVFPGSSNGVKGTDRNDLAKAVGRGIGAPAPCALSAAP